MAKASARGDDLAMVSEPKYGEEGSTDWHGVWELEHGERESPLEGIKKCLVLICDFSDTARLFLKMCFTIDFFLTLQLLTWEETT